MMFNSTILPIEYEFCESESTFTIIYYNVKFLEDFGPFKKDSQHKTLTFKLQTGMMYSDGFNNQIHTKLVPV